MRCKSHMAALSKRPRQSNGNPSLRERSIYSLEPPAYSSTFLNRQSASKKNPAA
jgi:hypothetical protein